MKEVEEKNRYISQVMLTKIGHVYIISNIGSFGEEMLKIGMTRRLEPMDRVKELGDASVPFLFDVHTMIRTSDAPTLENALHKHFDDRRVNLENNRKEFFYVTLEEIQNELNMLKGELNTEAEIHITHGG
ncbi:GIY-YIG nuclease family protein [Parasynechococcus sp.]|uniref:GIY-YIG nuclease family protein n=1 Tax=Parasynechococcus sp. TaxID=3101203 RepID=UPI003704C650